MSKPVWSGRRTALLRCGTGLDQFTRRSCVEQREYDLVGAEAVKPGGLARRDRMGLGEDPGLQDHHAAAATGAVDVTERIGGEQRREINPRATDRR